MSTTKQYTIVSHGKYVCTERDNSVLADRIQVNQGVLWEVIKLGHGKVHLKSAHTSKYLVELLFSHDLFVFSVLVISMLLF
jgi:hypothetical protein